jgi:hypothetical protein
VRDSRRAALFATPRGGGVVAFAIVTLLLAGLASAQGLGTAAARERERREKVKNAPAKVFTNDDLPGEAEGQSASDSAAEEGAEADPTVGESVDPVREELDRERERRAEQEEQWRARFAEVRARLAEAEARCWQEVIRTEFYNGIPVQMKVQDFVETEEFRQAKKALADLQEEFRRTGLPPGWARE